MLRQSEGGPHDSAAVGPGIDMMHKTVMTAQNHFDVSIGKVLPSGLRQSGFFGVFSKTYLIYLT
jgi:hypothetical protein